MRKLFILIVIAAAIALFTGFQFHSNENQKQNCQFIQESLNDISRIKIGMTRSDLLKVFDTEGGIYTRTQNHYVYKKCMFIRVDVKYSPVGGEQNSFAESPDDKIIEISKPYLGYSIMD